MAGSAKAPSPTSDGAGPDGADDPAEAEGDLAAEGDPSGEARPQAGPSEDKGGEPQKGASSAKPSKPGKPSSGEASGGTIQKPAAGGGQAQKPSKPKPGHTHSWKAVYRTEPVYSQQWVSKWEDVYTRHVCWECSACHGRFNSDAEIDSHIWGTYGDAQHPNGASAIDQSYTTVEKVDNGSYQNVQTGTRQVLDHYECPCGSRR